MALLVKYVDDGIGYIPNYELDILIKAKRISRFKRPHDGWVDAESGPIRGKGGSGLYDGPERRSRFNNFNPMLWTGMLFF